MRDRLKELIRQKSCFYVNCDGDCFNCTDKYSVLEDDVERIADHLLANGVIVPPCKVGDTVYSVLLYDAEDILNESFIEEYTVDGIGIIDGKWHVYVERDNDWYECGGINCKLTREEAEKALERSGK